MSRDCRFFGVNLGRQRLNIAARIVVTGPEVSFKSWIVTPKLNQATAEAAACGGIGQKQMNPMIRSNAICQLLAVSLSSCGSVAASWVEAGGASLS